MVRSIDGCDLVFLDPDNGVESGRPHATFDKRYVTFDEIRSIRRRGRTRVLIKFPARVQYENQEADYHKRLREETGAKRVLTLRTSVKVPAANGRFVPLFRWFSLVDPDIVLTKRLEEFEIRLNFIQRRQPSPSKQDSPFS